MTTTINYYELLITKIYELVRLNMTHVRTCVSGSGHSHTRPPSTLVWYVRSFNRPYVYNTVSEYVYKTVSVANSSREEEHT